LELLLKIGLAAMAAAILWSAFRPRAVFVVRIKDGLPRVASGTVTRAFLQQIGDTCSRHAVRGGIVRGVAKNRRIALVFSRNIAPACQQQLRNLWTLQGWTAGPDPNRPRT
jgi:Protein of unknown function (DUF3634)